MDKMKLQFPTAMPTISQERVAKIARYAHEVEGDWREVPISFQVALTDSCFNRCIGCGHPSRVQTRMPDGAWIDFLEHLPAELPESVCYSGGDPMAYPYFNKIMQWHVNTGVKFGCTITGYVPKSIDMRLLAKASWIRVSLDAIDSDVYAKVRGKTPLAKVMKSIDDMLEAGVNVELGVTLHPANEDQLPRIKAWAKYKGIKNIDVRYAYPQSNPLWEDVDLETRAVMPFNTCKAALHQLYIDSDGSVYPCCITAGDTRDGPRARSLGNIFIGSWSKIWAEAIVYSKIKRAHLPEVCRTCCIKRLSEINYVHDYLLTNTPSFF